MLDPSILIAAGQPALTTGHRQAATAEEMSAAAHRADLAEKRAAMLAAIVEIQSQLDAASELGEASWIASRLLRQSLAASRVWIAWKSSLQEGCRIVADSNQELSGQTESSNRLAESAAEESALRGNITHWPADDNKNRHALLAVKQFAQSVSADSLVAVSLVDDSGRVRGAVLAINANRSSAVLPEHFLDAIAQPLAIKLASVQRWQPGRIETIIHGIWEIGRSEKRQLAIWISLAIVVLMLLPLRYRVSATCELQPTERRLVAAPFDGPLESTLVRPGDVVSQGELLATINPREIEYELAGVQADLNRAQQEKKGLMAEHDVAGSKIAGLESERLRLRSELLDYQRGNLEIRSPLSGVVVSGDLKQSEGAPLSRGETLFEIAPLGEMVVEIAIAESDYGHVRGGMPVEFYVHAIPNRTLRGKIDRVHPRAELRDHENVFIGEVRISDPENVLRPGMRGRARIHSDRHTLGWNLFHKAYYALRSTVGW